MKLCNFPLISIFFFTLTVLFFNFQHLKLIIIIIIIKNCHKNFSNKKKTMPHWNLLEKKIERNILYIL